VNRLTAEGPGERAIVLGGSAYASFGGRVMGELRPWHIVVLVVLLILLFGAKRLPDGARSLGRSLRIFKAETEGLMSKDDRKDDDHRTID
jgi:TatA/E family protein of Tat protein translocase